MSKPIEHCAKVRGHEWRVQSDEDGRFDEIVIRDGRKRRGLVLHAEAMSLRSYFIDVAGLCLWVSVKNGVATITHQEDRR